MIAGKELEEVFVDPRSTMNLMCYKYLDRLGYKSKDLIPLVTVRSYILVVNYYLIILLL